MEGLDPAASVSAETWRSAPPTFWIVSRVEADPGN